RRLRSSSKAMVTRHQTDDSSNGNKRQSPQSADSS
ncbi:unnamed protein product, partial [Rotaria magnacalcarata]